MTSAVQEVDITNDTVVITEKTMQHFDDKNEATIIGTCIGKKECKNFSLLTVLTTAGRTKDLTSAISVRVSNNLTIPENILKARVEIAGKLRSRPVKRDGEEKTSYENYIEATSVSLAKSAMEEAFGLKGRSFGASYNSVLLTGTVSRMLQLNRNTAKITICVREAKQKERLVEGVFYARNNMKSLLPMIAAGNKICAVAELQNFKKDPMKSYTVNGKTMVKKEVVSEDAKPEYVKNVVFLDINEV